MSSVWGLNESPKPQMFGLKDRHRNDPHFVDQNTFLSLINPDRRLRGAEARTSVCHGNQGSYVLGKEDLRSRFQEK